MKISVGWKILGKPHITQLKCSGSLIRVLCPRLCISYLLLCNKLPQNVTLRAICTRDLTVSVGQNLAQFPGHVWVKVSCEVTVMLLSRAVEALLGMRLCLRVSRLTRVVVGGIQSHRLLGWEPKFLTGYWLEASFHSFPHGPLLGQLITRQLTPLSMNRRRTSREPVPKSEAAGFL